MPPGLRSSRVPMAAHAHRHLQLDSQLLPLATCQARDSTFQFETGGEFYYNDYFSNNNLCILSPGRCAVQHMCQ